MKLIQTITDNYIDYTGISYSVIEQLSIYKPHFQQWVIIQIKKGENYNSIIDAINYYITKVSDNRFQNLLKKYTPSPKNILFLSLDNIKTAQRDFEITYNRLSKRERDKLKSNVLIDRPDLKIVKFEKNHPGDVDAAKAVSAAAQNTRWCVCNVETAEYYLEQGPLFLLTVDNERYLCHIESNQLMDVNDKPKIFPERFCVVVFKYIPGFGLFCDDKKSNVYRQSIIYNPLLAYNYALVVKGRWPEAEPTIMKDSQSALMYARYVIKNRWLEAESTIMKSPAPAYNYARDIIKGRWLEAEPTIMQEPQWAYNYACDIIKCRWQEAESTIIQYPKWIFNYARDVVKGRWPQAEITIIQEVYWALMYARYVIKNRWLEAESTIMKSPDCSYWYAREVIKGRWPQAEQYIIQDPKWAYNYACDFIDDRWLKAEPNILNSPYSTMYKQRFGLK